MWKYKDYAWQKFWRLTAINFQYKKWTHTYWLCKCDCGNDIVTKISSLIYWWTRSCGCLRKERMISMHHTHWMANTIFYSKWTWIKTRCFNKNEKSYNYYWWRWIKCLWKNFEEFRDDMYESYLKHIEEFWEKETTIDRIDVNWNYCKENCRWCVFREQSYNRRNSREYIGVWYSKDKNKWWVWLCMNWINKSYWYFNTQEDAYKHRINLEKQFWVSSSIPFIW